MILGLWRVDHRKLNSTRLYYRIDLAFFVHLSTIISRVALNPENMFILKF